MKKIFMLLCVAAAVGTAMSCEPFAPIHEPESPETVLDPEVDDSAVLVNITADAGEIETKSRYCSDDSGIRDINVFIYKDGKLVSSNYAASSNRISVTLVKNLRYNFYVITNTGAKIIPPADEASVSTISVAVGKSILSRNGMQMAGSSTNVSITASTTSVSVGVKRLYAKLNFSVDTCLLRDVELDFTSVKIKNSGTVCNAFSNNRISSKNNLEDGDEATSSDMTRINSGDEITIYIPENMQGTLLPYNRESLNKTPDNMGPESALCSYVEVMANYRDASSHGTVKFRFFPGEDNICNFDVERNCEYNILLYPTDDMTDLDSWKIVADIVHDEPDPISFSLTQPNYCGQWGVLSIPSASSGNPVSVEISCSSGGSTRSLNVGTGSSQIFSFNGFLFVYSTSDPRSIYYMPHILHVNGYGSSNLPKFRMTQGAAGSTASVSVDPQYVGFVMGESSFMVNEDGRPYNVNLELSQNLSTFMSPVAVRSALGSDMDEQEKKWTYFEWVYYDDYAFGITPKNEYAYGDDPCDFGIDTRYCSVRNITSSEYDSVYDAWDDGVFGVFAFYGLETKSVNEATQMYFVPYHDGLCDGDGDYYSETVPFSVVPAFPDQRYLGEVINYQIAPGSMASSTTPMTFAGGAQGLTPTYNATWTVRHATFSSADRGSSLASVWSRSYNDDYCHNITMTRTRLTFGETFPTYFISSGSMIAQGSTTNPRTGRVITGYYTFDVVAYMTVGYQVAPNGYSSSFCFTPFTKFAAYRYFDMWNDNFPPVQVKFKYRNVSDYEYRTSHVCAPEWPDTDPDDWELFFRHLSQQVNRYSSFQTLSLLYSSFLTSELMNFNFYDSGTGLQYNSLDLTRNSSITNNPSSSYYDLRNGLSGFYKIYRQYDVNNLPDTYNSYGMQNRLLECAYGSFINY